MFCVCSCSNVAMVVVLAAIILALLQPYIGGGVCYSTARLDGKFVIITGANTGIGKETARDLTSRGARVMLACRNLDRCRAASDDIYNMTRKRVAIKQLNLADLDSVRQFSKEINTEEPKLHLLINNAGVMMCPKTLSAQGYELQFATNHLGHFLLTNLLLDLLKKSAPSRILVVSSKAYARGYINFDDINSDKEYGRMSAYSQSKLANILFANELSAKLKGTRVTVNSLHPGVIASDLARHIADMVPHFLQFITNGLYRLVALVGMKNTVQGAQTTICCAIDEALEGVTGKYFSDCVEQELEPQAKNKEDAKRLWKLSEKMTGLNKNR